MERPPKTSGNAFNWIGSCGTPTTMSFPRAARPDTSGPIATATSGDAMGPLVSGLAARGKLIVVGVPQDPIQLNAFPLVFGGRSIYGSLTGTPIDSEDTLAFSVLENIRPMIETLPLEQAADAYARMMQGKARFRMVLVTGQ